MALIIPKDYDPKLSIRQTQEAIKYIRDTFQKEFGREMNLERISTVSPGMSAMSKDTGRSTPFKSSLRPLLLGRNRGAEMRSRFISLPNSF